MGSRSSRQPTLGELLGEKKFELSLVVGGTSATTRPVLGAHTEEVERPSRWLAPGWVMLTTGLRLNGEPEEQRKLIGELDEHGVTALGLALGVGFDEVPESLAEEAREREFPVFAIPNTTRFRDIEVFIQRACLDSELRTGQRILAAQRYLLDSLEEDEPFEELLRRLVSLTRARVWLLDEGGRCLYSREGDPTEGVAEEIAKRPETVLTFDSHGSRHVAVPIRGGAEAPLRWLVLAGADPAFSEAFVKGVAQAAAGMLVAIDRLEGIRRRQEDSAGSGLLDALLDDVSATEKAIVVRCAAAVNVVIEGSIVVVAESSEATSEELRRRFNAALRRSGAAGLVAVRDRRVTALLSGAGEPPIDMLGGLTDADPGLRIGIGTSIGDIGAVRRSFHEATLALETSTSPGLHRNLPGGDLDLTELLLSGGHQELVAQRSAEILAPLREHDLLKTLATYFACDMNVGHAAYALEVHPNTVRHRLHRIEQLLDSPLQRPATVTALQVALRCSELEF
ncbi:MAG: PucR family transcriptional regulator [Solirubrobacterales bacterium]